MNDVSYGLWAGLGVDNTAEATAAGALYSDAAGKVAVLAKTTRNAMIGFVVLAYALYWAGRGQAEAVTNKAVFLWKKFPKFVLGFILMSLLVGFHAFSKAQVASLGKSVQMGIPADFCGCRPAHEYSRDVETRVASVHRRGSRGGPDRVPDAWFSGWCKSDLGFIRRTIPKSQPLDRDHPFTDRVKSLAVFVGVMWFWP